MTVSYISFESSLPSGCRASGFLCFIFQTSAAAYESIPIDYYTITRKSVLNMHEHYLKVVHDPLLDLVRDPLHLEPFEVQHLLHELILEVLDLLLQTRYLIIQLP